MDINNIVQKIIENIKSNPILKNVDTRIGTVLRDAIISPISSVILDVYKYIDDLFNKNNINNASGEDLDNIALSYGIKRRVGSKATGTVRFYARIQPNSNIVITIPAGVNVYGFDENNQKISFVTLYTGSISYSSNIEDDINNPFYGYQYYETIVEAEEEGSKGNVIKGFINYTDFASVEGVTNIEDFSNGEDQESDEQFRERIVKYIYGNYGTIIGYEHFAYERTNVYDVKVITPNDPIFKRKESIGSLDIVVIPSKIINTETVTYINNNKAVIPYKPIKDINFIYYLDQNNNIIQIDRSEYIINMYNFNDEYLFSPIDSSHILFNNSNYNGKLVYINYSYYKEVYDLHKIINSFDYKIIGTDVLIRRGLIYYLLIDSLDVKIKLGYSFENVKKNIVSELVNMVNSTKLGGSIQMTDIIDISYVNGVDFVSDTPDVYLIREDIYKNLNVESRTQNDIFNLINELNNNIDVIKYSGEYYNIKVDNYSYIRTNSNLITNMSIEYS